MNRIFSLYRSFIFAFAFLVLLTAGCARDTQELDLVNDDAQKRQAFNQILNNPQLQNEFLLELKGNREAMNRMFQNREFTGELFKKENMNYMLEQNPGMDTAVIDNVATRMHTDTLFMKEFHRRMEQGTSEGTPK